MLLRTVGPLALAMPPSAMQASTGPGAVSTCTAVLACSLALKHIAGHVCNQCHLFIASAPGWLSAVRCAALYDALGASLTSERVVLLLYTLLHGCPNFHEYCLVGAGCMRAAWWGHEDCRVVSGPAAAFRSLLGLQGCGGCVIDRATGTVCLDAVLGTPCQCCLLPQTPARRSFGAWCAPQVRSDLDTILLPLLELLYSAQERTANQVWRAHVGFRMGAGGLGRPARGGCTRASGRWRPRLRLPAHPVRRCTCC